ncbi:MAG: sigma-54 dependent transcriptional regulator [Myxococcota bacterium]|jgi:two-component system, NtrC family, nitrogen regulation response regulator GlnG|nr:sigma-54 dependent transcriptional regulator [Myxococcota bacterium]
MTATAESPLAVLVADDEESIRFVLREALEAEGHRVNEVADGESALDALSSDQFDIAFLDIRMPGHSGLEILDQLRATGSNTAVVIITAQNTMDNAVEAMKRGALDYLVKPFSLAQISALIERARSTRVLRDEVRELRREAGGSQRPGNERLVGRSAAMLDIFKLVGKVAVRNVPVLITGESGTGKELVARAIHSASPRSDRAFVTVNAAAIPSELLESELFGHERGAFTGAISARLGRFREASGGTLFLDEIGDMPVGLQAKLLRVLQDGEVTPVGGRDPIFVDVRVITATHRNLDQAVSHGNFREDLLYRLRVVPIEIPSLRERTEDVRTLAEFFTHRYSNELVEESIEISEQALSYLEKQRWPGNVRELENAIKRALVLVSTKVLSPTDFHFLESSFQPDRAGQSLEDLIVARIRDGLAEDQVTDLHRKLIESVERPLLDTILKHTDGNQIRAAALLGINRNTLRKKIVELGIELPGKDESP